ncbi:MAG: alpha/beta fold hydrolase [Brachybacterium tyrofermentans]
MTSESTDSTPSPSPRPVVLVPGYWLGGWAWEEVVQHLHDANVSATAVTLPGMDPGDPERASRGLEEQADHLERLVTELVAESGPVVLVAHSGGNLPVMRLLGRSPELVAHVVWVDSGPQLDGTIGAPDLPSDISEVALPPYEELAETASLEGLTARQLDCFRERAVPQPAAVMREPLHLETEGWRDLPATMVCCSLTSQDVQGMAGQGHPMMAPVTAVRDLELVDLPTGHWPQWSRPDDLATLLAERARRVAPAALTDPRSA